MQQRIIASEIPILVFFSFSVFSRFGIETTVRQVSVPSVLSCDWWIHRRPATEVSAVHEEIRLQACRHFVRDWRILSTGSKLSKFNEFFDFHVSL